MIAHLKESIFIGLSGLSLTPEEKNWLLSPKVGGVILFQRNFSSLQQLKRLTNAIKELRDSLLVSVDHEGGRVQRFHQGFTTIPPMRELGISYDQNPKDALAQAKHYGHIIARELKEVGIDFSYTPVCDLDYGVNPAIGSRAFHRDPLIVASLARALYQGLKEGGSIGVAKHFPGHGYCQIDTHLEKAVDNRPLATLMENDLLPFKALIEEGVEAIMPSHIIYPTLDKKRSALTSPRWIAFLREELGFKGAIISDDLDMKAFLDDSYTIEEKVDYCFKAGVNIALLCNNFTNIRDYITSS